MLVSRKGFLRGRFRGESQVIRPPWASGEPAFQETCDGCAKCADACPEKIIVTGGDGLPEVDFSGAGCSFCGDCATACPTGALADRGQAPWRHKAHITSLCFSWQGVVCRLCEEQCEPRAIRFRPALGGYALPEIDAGACNGCGACVGVCPSGAVEMAVELTEAET